MGSTNLVSDCSEAAEAGELGEVDSHGQNACGKNYNDIADRILKVKHPATLCDHTVQCRPHKQQECCHWPGSVQQHFVAGDAQCGLLVAAQQLLAACTSQTTWNTSCRLCTFLYNCSWLVVRFNTHNSTCSYIQRDKFCTMEAS